MVSRQSVSENTRIRHEQMNNANQIRADRYTFSRRIYRFASKTRTTANIITTTNKTAHLLKMRNEFNSRKQMDL